MNPREDRRFSNGQARIVEQVHAKKTRRNRADQTERRDNRQPRHALVLAPHGLVFQILAHLLHLLADVLVEPVEIEMAAAQVEQVVRLILLVTSWNQ